MPGYSCRCRESSGRRVRLRRWAESPDRLRSSLIAEGYIPIVILPEENVRGLGGETLFGRLGGTPGFPGRGGGRKVRMGLKDAQEFAETMALLLEGGHTLKEAMGLLRGFRTRGPIAEAAESVSGRLEKGDGLRDSLEKAPVLFPPGFISLAGIGESAGSLAAVMSHLGRHYKRLKALREKLGTAMVYPSLVLAAALGAGIFLSAVTLPNLRAMMEAVENADFEGGSESEGGIPGEEAPAGVPMGVIAGGSGALAGLLILLYIRGRWRRKAAWKGGSGLALRLPGLGGFLINWNLMGWTFALEMLAGQGLPMDKALDEAAGAVGHRLLRRKMRALAGEVGKGDSLSDLLARDKMIPPVLAGWLRIGERTGQVQRVFGTLREYFENRVNRSIDLAAQLVEPVLIMLVGMGMLIVVSRFILPLFRMLGGLL